MASALAWGAGLFQTSTRETETRRETDSEALSEAIGRSRRTAVVDAAERASPAVVAVGTIEQMVSGVPFGPWILDPQYVDHPSPFLGSGVVIDADEGLIVTNDHVVRGLQNFLVTLSSGDQLEARLVGSDPNNDIALLRVQAEDLPEIPIGHSTDLMIGEWAIAIGNPFGSMIGDPKPTVTVGVISALNRAFPSGPRNRHYYNMIQTDAGINPGNSGGALVNARGELIGINTFIISTTGSSNDIAFAIPVDRVQTIVQEIRTHGKVRSVYRDFLVRTNRSWMAEQLDRPFQPGALVVAIDEHGPASKAGLRNGDVITGVNGREVETAADLEEYRFILRVGEPIQIRVWRPGEELSVEYELDAERQ
jgi:serine protease Do